MSGGPSGAALEAIAMPLGTLRRYAYITGIAGFLGRHFAAELRARGWTVDGCDITTGGDAMVKFSEPAYPYAVRYDLVVHCAAASPHRLAIDTQPMQLAYNVALDAALFSWAQRTGQGRVIYLSSCAVLDGPDDYGWTKLTGERMAAAARRAGLGVTVVRPWSGYGEDQPEHWPFGAFAARARRREDPFEIWGDGSQVRDWIHVSDVVNGALAVADGQAADGTDHPVNLCTGTGTSMLRLAQMLCEASGYEPRFRFRDDRPRGQQRRIGSPTLLHRYYTPRVTLEEGVRRAFAEGSAIHEHQHADRQPQPQPADS